MEPGPRHNPNDKPKACRKLIFSEGPSIDDDHRRFIEESLQKDLEEKKKKYNFDFTNERMLNDDGSIIWTKTEDGGKYDWIGKPNNQPADEAEDAKDNEGVPKTNDENHSEKNDAESKTNVLENCKENDVDTR